MDSSYPKEIKEKIEEYKKLIDSAFELFDGKYSIKEIENMAYKELLEKIEREQIMIQKNAETKATKKIMKELGV